MGLMSSLRSAPKSDKIRAQLEATEQKLRDAEAGVVAAREIWRTAVVDGTDADKVAKRSDLRRAENDLEEVRVQRQELAALLAETLEQEEAQAARDAWKADVDATRKGWRATEKLLADYEKQAAALTATVRALYDEHAEWLEIERRADGAGQLQALYEEAGIPAAPGRTRTGRKLFEETALRQIPRLDEGHGPWYQVRPHD